LREGQRRFAGELALTSKRFHESGVRGVARERGAAVVRRDGKGRMSRSRREFRAHSVLLSALASILAGIGCSDAMDAEGALALPTQKSQALTASERLAACANDPRVVAGLVTAQVCAGADIFFNETFAGNGRTCGSCHPAANNTTIDVPFVTALHQSDPMNPLFVNEFDANLAQLETSDLLREAAILENVDGFEDPTHKFVSRGVNHVLSLRTSISRDSGDGTTNPPAERVGWGGDGSDDGTLRGFLAGAVRQHFTKNLARREGTDFRVPTNEEAGLTEAFQLSLGRLNELNLQQVNLFDAEANEGRRAFLDPVRGRCNVCHTNAGANFIDSGKNRNLDSGTRSVGIGLTLGSFDGDQFLSDGGFGGKGLARPNFDASGIGFPESFGNGTFNPPPLIEAADTAPFFHNNFRPNIDLPPKIEDAVAFYARVAFTFSPAAEALVERFGEFNLAPLDAFAIARFLRVLNAALNLDIARQRLDAAQTLVNRFGDTRADVQRKLMELAGVEIDDALEVLAGAANGPIYPNATPHLDAAQDEIDAGITASNASTRQNRISNALSRVMNARDLFGANIDFQLGQGNLMY
jgi:cytochrome c peroxidase